jgi:hypothetical protein
VLERSAHSASANTIPDADITRNEHNLRGGRAVTLRAADLKTVLLCTREPLARSQSPTASPTRAFTTIGRNNSSR